VEVHADVDEIHVFILEVNAMLGYRYTSFHSFKSRHYNQAFVRKRKPKPKQKSNISASELDLLTFFEVEPTLSDPALPWIYNDALYTIWKGEVDLSFAIAPSYKCVRIILKHGGAVVYELNSKGVGNVKYHKDGGRECLEIIISRADKLLLNLKPAVSLSQVVDSEAPLN
jgi:hypothetical protein